MKKLRVGELEFSSIEEVEKWAWNVHKIDVDPELKPLTHEEQQAECDKLHLMIKKEELGL